MNVRKRTFFRAFALLALVGISLAGAALRPRLSEHWALYLGEPGSARLFLDPFPDRTSCQARVAAFAANHERSFCGVRYDWELGGAEDAVLAADFGIFSPGRFLCVPRRHDSRGSAP